MQKIKPHNIKSLIVLYQQLDQKRRAKIPFLITSMLVGAIIEMIAIGSTVPFLSILMKPTIIENNAVSRKIISTLGINPAEGLALFTLIYIFFIIFSSLTRIIINNLILKFTYKAGNEISTKLFQTCLNQNYEWHVNKNSSEIISTLQKVDIVIQGIIVQLAIATVGLIVSIAILTTLMIINVKIAFISGFSFVVLYASSAMALKRKLNLNSNAIAKNDAERLKIIQEGLGGIREIIIDKTQKFYLENFQRIDEKIRLAQASNNLMGMAPRYIIEGFGISLLILIAFTISRSATGVEGAIPVLGAMGVAAQRLLPQMQQCYAAWSSITGNIEVLNDVIKLMREDQTKVQVYHNLEIKNSNPENLKFDIQDLCYKPLHSSRYILNNVNIKIAKSSVIGIIGKTGVGKSTLIDLMMGLIKPSKGKIIFYTNQNSKCPANIEATGIAHIPQSIYLADMSIRENIAFGLESQEIDSNRIDLSIKLAELSEFIRSLPEGINTVVGERGVKLSGGQRQRIGIARALYKDFDLLFLDEATSALDTETEEKIINNIRSIHQDITIIMITHRTNTLSICDRILRIEDGQVLNV